MRTVSSFRWAIVSGTISAFCGGCQAVPPYGDPWENRLVTVTVWLPQGFDAGPSPELRIVVDEKPDASSLFAAARDAATEIFEGRYEFETLIAADIDSDPNLEWRARVVRWPFDGGSSWSIALAGQLTAEFQIGAFVVIDGGEVASGRATTDTTGAAIRFGPSNRMVTVNLACVQGVACAGADAGALADAGAGTDAGAVADAGADAGTDAGADAGADAGVDAGFGADAGSDAGADAGQSAAVVDASAPIWQSSVVLEPTTTDGGWLEVYVTPQPPGSGSGMQFIWQTQVGMVSRVYVNAVQPWSGVAPSSAILLSETDGGGTFLPRITTTDWSSMASWNHYGYSADSGIAPTLWTSFWYWTWGPRVAIPPVTPMIYPSSVTVAEAPVYQAIWLDSFDAGVFRYVQSDGGNSFGAPSSFGVGDTHVLGVRAPIRRSGFYPVVYQGCNLGGEMICAIKFTWWQSLGGWSPFYRVDQSDGRGLFEPIVVVGERAAFSWKKSVGNDGGAEIWATLCNSAGTCTAPNQLGTAQVYFRDMYSTHDLPSFDMQANASDDVAVAWVDDDAGIFVARFDPQFDGGNWRPAALMAPRGARDVRVDVTPSGRVVVAWIENYRVYARWYHKQANVWFDAGEISAPQVGGDGVSIAVTGESAFAAWNGSGTLWGAWCPPP